MAVGIRIFNDSGSTLIDDRFHNVALQSSATNALFTAYDANGTAYYFGNPPVLGSGVGIRVFNSIDHTVAFDSRVKYARVVDVQSGGMTIGTIPAKGQPPIVDAIFTKTYPSGTTYAWAELVHAFARVNNGPTQGAVSATSIAITGTTVKVMRSTGAIAGQGTYAQHIWTYALLDVTGY